LIRGRRRRHEPLCVLGILDQQALRNQRVEVDVDVQRKSKALDGRDRTPGAAGNPAPLGTAALEAEQGANECAQHRAAETMIPGEGVPQPVRQGQDPLAHGQATQHAIDQMRRQLGHPPAATPRAKPAPLQENATRISRWQSVQRKRANPSARTPQVRKSRNSRSTKRGRPSPLPRGGPRQERSPGARAPPGTARRPPAVGGRTCSARARARPDSAATPPTRRANAPPDPLPASPRGRPHWPAGQQHRCQPQSCRPFVRLRLVTVHNVRPG
jgi:hypothetical protein